MLKKNELIKFIIKAKKSSYANENAKKLKTKDNAKLIKYKNDAFRYQDKYYGFESFSGQEIVFHKNIPIWSMNYYGGIKNRYKCNIPEKEIYNFLRKALMKINKKTPFRGPENHSDKEFRYKNKIKGNIDSFNGIETIYYKNKKAHHLIYHGGLIKY